MSMEPIVLAVDVGCAILAWLVQAIIYPGMRDIDSDRFPTWHSWYTRRITWFVGPLMVGQVLLYAYLLVEGDTSLPVVLAAVLILATWIITGLLAVPKHAGLSRDGQSDDTIDHLLKANLYRSLCWTVIVVTWVWR